MKGAAHGPGEVAGDGETEACAADAFGGGVVKALEGLEDALALGGGNAGAVVLDVDDELVVPEGRGEAEPFSADGVFFNVGDEVPDDLGEGIAVEHAFE